MINLNIVILASLQHLRHQLHIPAEITSTLISDISLWVDAKQEKKNIYLEDRTLSSVPGKINPSASEQVESEIPKKLVF